MRACLNLGLMSRRSADAHKDNGSLFHGGKALENAAGLAKDLKKMPESINLLRDAAGCYRQAGVGAPANCPDAGLGPVRDASSSLTLAAHHAARGHGCRCIGEGGQAG